MKRGQWPPGHRSLRASAELHRTTADDASPSVLPRAMALAVALGLLAGVGGAMALRWIPPRSSVVGNPARPFTTDDVIAAALNMGMVGEVRFERLGITDRCEVYRVDGMDSAGVPAGGFVCCERHSGGCGGMRDEDME